MDKIKEDFMRYQLNHYKNTFVLFTASQIIALNTEIIIKTIIY